MPYLRIWIHLVFATRNREPLLPAAIRPLVWKHIQDNARQKGIFLDCVNGHADHVHVLVSLGTDQTIAELVQLIKGECSFWINKQKLINGKFSWQEEYFAVSVSESVVDRVRTYIQNQEEHHRRKSFTEEVQDFMDKYGFRLMEKEGKLG